MGAMGGLPGMANLGMGSANFMEMQQRMQSEVPFMSMRVHAFTFTCPCSFLKCQNCQFKQLKRKESLRRNRCLEILPPTVYRLNNPRKNNAEKMSYYCH